MAATEIITWRPQFGPQAIAIDARYAVDELFLGGGKSDYLLGDFLADVSQGANWQGILFRRTYPELYELIRRSHVLYRGAEYKVGKHEWRFASGGTLKFRHIDSVHDAAHYQDHAYRDEILNMYVFETLSEVRAITEEWMDQYNEERSHDALGDLTPFEHMTAHQQRENSNVDCH